MEEKIGADPLQVLRHFVKNNKEIKEVDGLYVFGDIAYPKSARTCYPVFTGSVGSSAVSDTDDDKTEDGEVKRKEYYTLETLRYFLKHSKLNHPMYVKKVCNLQSQHHRQIQIVTRADRANLLNYLQGSSDRCDGIDPQGPMELPVPAPAKLETGKTEKKRAGHKTADKEKGGAPLLLNRKVYEEKMAAGQLLSTDPSSLIDTSTSASAQTEDEQKVEAPSILSAMGPDKILELKAKRRAVKAHEVVDVSSLDRKPYDPASAGNDTKIKAEPMDVDADYDSFQPMDVDRNPFIQQFFHERVYSTRNTVLQSQKTNFLKSVSRLLEEVKHKEERVKKFGVTAAKAWMSTNRSSLSTSTSTASKTPAQAPQQSKQLTPYSRYDQQAKLPLGTDEFGINPLQTFSKGLLKDSVQKSMETVGGNPTSAMSSAMSASHTSSSRKRLRREPPIIIVPDTPHSLITMLNAKDILEDQAYVTNEEKRGEGIKRLNEILIHRKKPGGGNGKFTYKVTSSPEKFGLKDWERVVAVFIVGKTWQFKGWPWNANPVEICSRLNAFNLKYDDMEPEGNVKNWPVRIINVSRTRRYLDKAAMVGFWTFVDDFICKSKPFLLQP